MRNASVWGAGLRSGAARLADVVWPGVCGVCGRPLGPTGTVTCFECAREIAELVGEPYCQGCGDARHPHLLIDGRCGHCRSDGARFGAFIRVARYVGPLRSLILRFKREFVLDHCLGGFLADAITGNAVAAAVECWTPVPSPFRRRVLRGFQPTRLLAEEVGRRLGRPARPLLRMTRYVPRFHHGMAATTRAEVIRGALAVKHPSAVRGRAIGIIDDVSTTGATLDEARRVLKAAGASSVVAAVLAKR